jgi:hypothetical protein
MIGFQYFSGALADNDGEILGLNPWLSVRCNIRIDLHKSGRDSLKTFCFAWSVERFFGRKLLSVQTGSGE